MTDTGNPEADKAFDEHLEKMFNSVHFGVCDKAASKRLSVLCYIGFHAWDRDNGFQRDGRVWYRCLRCGKELPVDIKEE